MADNPTAPKPPIRSPFFDFIGDETGKTRRQLGQLSREWLIFFQQQQKVIDQVAASIEAGAGGGTGAGGATGTAPVLTTVTASAIYAPYGNLWQFGFTYSFDTPAWTTPYVVMVLKVDPSGHQSLVDTITAPAGSPDGVFPAGTNSYTAPPVNAVPRSSQNWKLRFIPVDADNVASAYTDTATFPVRPATILSVTSASEAGPRTNIANDDPTTAPMRGLLTSITFTVNLQNNPGGTTGVQQVVIWFRYDRGDKNPDGTAAGPRTFLQGSFPVTGNSSVITVPNTWVTTVLAGVQFDVIAAIWLAEPSSMTPPTEVLPPTVPSNTGRFTMGGPLQVLPTSAQVDKIVYWTIPGGFAWGFHTITFMAPFYDANFKASELTVQKVATTGALTPAKTPDGSDDPEGIERSFAGTAASRTPYLNITVDPPVSAGLPSKVSVTLLTAWTMPSADWPGGSVNPYRRFIIRVKNTRQDETREVVSCWGTGTAPTDCAYAGDRLEIIPSLANAELTATAFDPTLIGQGLYLDPNGIIQENTGWNPSQMLPNASFEDGILGTYTGGGTAGAGPFAPGQGLPSGWTVNPALNPPHNPPTTTSGLSLVASPVLSGSKAMQLCGSHTQLTLADKFICRAGDAFYAECWIQSTTSPTPNGVFRIAIFFYDTSGALMSGSIVLRDYPTGAEVLPGAAWKKVTSTAQAPTGAAYMSVVFGTSGTTVGCWFLDNVLLRPILPGDVIQHGSTVGTDANGNLIINTDGVTMGTAVGYCNVNNTGLPPYTTPGNIVSWSRGPGYLLNVDPGLPSAKFGPGMVGQSIVISGTTYTVTGYTAPAGGNEATLTISGTAALTQVPYSIGSVVLIPALTIQTNNLTTGSLGDLTKYSDTIRAITAVFGLPTLPSSAYPQGALVFNLNDGKIYRNAGGVISSGGVVSSGSGYTPNSSQILDVVGGGGQKGQIKVSINATGQVVQTDVADPGTGYTSTPANMTVPASSGGGGSGGVISIGITTSGSGAAWPFSPWVYTTKPQDIIAGTILANVIYAGKINADQVTAGTFTGFHFIGSDLVLNLNGVTTSINNAADSLAGGFRALQCVDNSFSNRYTAVGKDRFSVILNGSAVAVLRFQPDPGTGFAGGVLELTAVHRSLTWSDTGLSLVSPGVGSATGQTVNVNYAKAGGGSGTLNFADGFLIGAS